MRRFRFLWMMLMAFPLAFVACSEDNTDNDQPLPPVVVETELQVSLTQLDFEAAGGTLTFTLTANKAWSITSDATWLTITPASGEEATDLSIQVVAEEHSDFTAREAEIKVACEELSETIYVAQAAAEQEDPTPTPQIPIAENVNTYVINGQEFSFESVAISMVGENPSVFATPTPGLTEWIDIMSSEEYFFVGINPALNGQEFDMMTEQTLFTMMSTLSGAFLESVAPEMLTEIQAGKCYMNYDAEAKNLTLQAGVVLADGATLAVNLFAEEKEEEIVINENVIIRGEEEKLIRASFYMDLPEEGYTIIYLTPGAISYFEELELVTSYLYIAADYSLLTGEEFDITTLSGDSIFMLGYEDQLDPSNSWAISVDDLQGATGMFSVAEIENENYAVTVEVTYEGIPFAAYFEGPCISSEVEMPEVDKTNMFFYQGDSWKIIEGACVMDGETWLVDLILANGQMISITIPASFCDGEYYGFSQSPDLTVSYDEIRTFSYANGDSGTVSVLVDEMARIAEIEFTNYDDCEFMYAGPIEIIK